MKKTSCHRRLAGLSRNLAPEKHRRLSKTRTKKEKVPRDLNATSRHLARERKANTTETSAGGETGENGKNHWAQNWVVRGSGGLQGLCSGTSQIQMSFGRVYGCVRGGCGGGEGGRSEGTFGSSDSTNGRRRGPTKYCTTGKRDSN